MASQCAAFFCQAHKLPWLYLLDKARCWLKGFVCRVTTKNTVCCMLFLAKAIVSSFWFNDDGDDHNNSNNSGKAYKVQRS